MAQMFYPPATVRAPAGIIALPIASIVAVLGIVVLGTDILAVTLRGGAMESLVRATQFTVYAAALALAVLTGALPRALVASPLMAALLVLPWLSVLWSVDPGMTVWRSSMLTGTTVFALFLGWFFPRDQLLRLLAIGSGIAVALSAGLIVAVPSIGIDRSEAWAGAWIGAYMHKNGFGAAMSAALIILLLAGLDGKGIARLLALGLAVVAAALIAGSLSATGLLVAFLTLALAGALFGWRRSRRLGLTVILAGLIFSPVVAYLLGQGDLLRFGLDLLEKDATAHGRTEIWQLVWPYIQDRFWLGYGYASFWQPSFPWVSQIEARLHYLPHYSHNGLVEVWIAGGVVAVGLFLAWFAVTLAKSMILALTPGVQADAILPILVMVGFASRNVTEASILQANDLLWLLFVAMATTVSRDVAFRLRPQSEVQPGCGSAGENVQLGAGLPGNDHMRVGATPKAGPAAGLRR